MTFDSLLPGIPHCELPFATGHKHAGGGGELDHRNWRGMATEAHEFFAGTQIPELHFTSHASAHKRSPIGGHPQRRDATNVTEESHLLVCSHGPYTHDAI